MGARPPFSDGLVGFASRRPPSPFGAGAVIGGVIMEVDVDPETARRFREAFLKLPLVQQEIFRLHRLENLSFAEIAWLLKVSEGFVERQLAKAILKIAKQMDGAKLSWWERIT